MLHTILMFACIAIIPAITTLSIAFTPTPLATGEKIVVEATDQVSAGISFMPRSKYKFMKAGAAASASPLAILTEWNAIFGPLVVGRKVFIRARVIGTNGQASAWIKTDAIVA